LNICPRDEIIRRTKVVGSDKIDLIPDYNIANIEKVVVHIDEPVVVKLLGFHVKDELYCNSYEITLADKRYCEGMISKYVHFQITKEVSATEQKIFLIAFLPRIKLDNELDHIANEISNTIDFLEINQNVNCLLFRFGKPIHHSDSNTHWQKQFDKRLAVINRKYKTIQINGRIKQVCEGNGRSLTISSAPLFDSINVS